MAKDQDTHYKWFDKSRDNYSKNGYGGYELPGRPTYFQTYPGKKPDAMPLKYLSREGPSGKHVPHSQDEEGPAYNQYLNFLQSAVNIGDVKTNKPEDLFWWLPFMWAGGDIAKWGSIYRAMGVNGILDNGHHRVHPSQPIQAVILDAVNNDILEHFTLKIGKNSFTKDHVLKHGEPANATETQYKTRSLYRYANKFLDLMDQMSGDLGEKSPWRTVYRPDPDNFLTDLDKWGRKLGAVAKLVKSVENVGSFPLTRETVSKLQAIDPNQADPQSRPLVQYVKDTLLKLASPNTAAA